MSRPPRVSVLVVSHRSQATIAACLASVQAESARVALETVLVDNASPDATADLVEREFPGVTLLRAGENRGFAWGVNHAAAIARGEYFLLLNPDAELCPGAVAELVRVLDEDRDTAIIGPRLIASDGRAELSDGAHSSFWGEACQRLRARVPWAQWRSLRPRHVDWVSGAALLIRADDFRAAGGMDEAFFLYFEDVDLCARVRAMGRDVRFWPRAEVRHQRGGSGAGQTARVAAAYRTSQRHFYRKHFGPEAEALLRVWLALTGKPDGNQRANGSA